MCFLTFPFNCTNIEKDCIALGRSDKKHREYQKKILIQAVNLQQGSVPYLSVSELKHSGFTRRVPGTMNWPQSGSLCPLPSVFAPWAAMRKDLDEFSHLFARVLSNLNVFHDLKAVYNSFAFLFNSSTLHRQGKGSYIGRK